MSKVLWLGDAGVNSGFGRIANETCSRLSNRGHQVHAVSILWDGIMSDETGWYSPLNHKYPFHISGIAGRDTWSYFYNLVNLTNPDIVIVCQDFPYASSAYYNCRIDWSRRAFALITPIDGEPIAQDWLNTVDDADGAMVISEFGVQAMKRAGRRVDLCPPGIDAKYFRPANRDEKLSLRERAGIPPHAFVLGMMAMNQGRKDIPHTLDGFKQFALDKPDAYLLLDMDRVNPAGWNIPNLAKTKDIPESKIIYKEDLMKRGLVELRDRFALLDAHSVLSHREGFGLPLVESQAMQIPTIAMDWCSGTEIVGNGKGYLVRRLPQSRNSTWGNALDYDPDVEHFVQILETIYTQPLQAAAIAERGYEWAIQRTWDKAADAVEDMLLRVERKLNERRIGYRAYLQPAPASPPAVRNVPGAQAEPVEGRDPDGRLLAGVRPAGVDLPAVPGVPERDEPGIRQERKRRRKKGDGEVPALLEQ